MEHWLSRPQFLPPVLGGDAPQTTLWGGSAHLTPSRTAPDTDMPSRNVYWVPVKKRQVDSVIATHNAILKRQNIPKLDGPSTAGVIAAVVIFVLAIMGMMIFLIWRHTRYQKKTRSLKQEAEEMVQASDARHQMVVHANMALGVPCNHYGHRTIQERAKSTETQRIREIGIRNGLETGTARESAEADDRSFRTAAASINTTHDGVV